MLVLISTVKPQNALTPNDFIRFLNDIACSPDVTPVLYCSDTPFAIETVLSLVQRAVMRASKRSRAHPDEVWFSGLLRRKHAAKPPV
jgi:hypothetical protein